MKKKQRTSKVTRKRATKDLSARKAKQIKGGTIYIPPIPEGIKGESKLF